MKKFIYIALAMLMVIALFAGCNTQPKPPPVVVEGIVCEGGVYNVYYGTWSQTGCEGSEQVAGTYWRNKDGRIFLIGEAVDIKKVVEVYGKCPVSYISEVKIK